MTGGSERESERGRWRRFQLPFSCCMMLRRPPLPSPTHPLPHFCRDPDRARVKGRGFITRDETARRPGDGTTTSSGATFWQTCERLERGARFVFGTHLCFNAALKGASRSPLLSLTHTICEHASCLLLRLIYCWNSRNIARVFGCVSAASVIACTWN